MAKPVDLRIKEKLEAERINPKVIREYLDPKYGILVKVYASYEKPYLRMPVGSGE